MGFDKERQGKAPAHRADIYAWSNILLADVSRAEINARNRTLVVFADMIALPKTERIEVVVQRRRTMELKTKDGDLTLGSAYRLIVTAWVLSWGAFMGFVLLLLLLLTLLTGEMTVNGELVEGRGAALASMLPMLVLFPVVIVMHAFMFGGFLIGGLWLYRLKRPLRVTNEDG